MNRHENISLIKNHKDPFDVLVIGGGATGLGVALDSASRGFKTVLIERSDFAKATSSRSTKLAHGGLRYLQQGNISLVFEALHERGLLYQNAPHLVHHRPFLVPNYKWWEGPFYGFGLKIYDLLAGKLGLYKSKHVNLEETIEAIPTIETEGLKGSTIYYDGQFDDARMAITLAQTASQYGAYLTNYVEFQSFRKKNKKIIGVIAKDHISGEEFPIDAKAVINATGIFSDEIRQKDEQTIEKRMVPSQGVHLVVPKTLLPGDTALLIPKTADNRVLFLVPWFDRVLLGTTDTAVEKPVEEPTALEEEIEFILSSCDPYLSRKPTRDDVLSVFAGIRPLVKSPGAKSTSQIARNHQIIHSPSGLLTITGGKWTTYRKMAEETIDEAISHANLEYKKCITHKLPLHGFEREVNFEDPRSAFGSDLEKIALIEKEENASDWIHPSLPYKWADLIWSIRTEMAQSIEDLLSRRTRSLLLDARASLEAAKSVGELLAKELNKDSAWIAKEVQAFQQLAKNYIL